MSYSRSPLRNDVDKFAKAALADPKKDIYSILGVEKGATAEDIKKAYRAKSLTTHPDKGGSAEAFKELQTIYEILTNDEAKKDYDERFSKEKKDAKVVYYSLDQAIRENNLRAIAEMKQWKFGDDLESKGWNVAHLAARMGDTELLKAAIAKKDNLNHEDELKRTPIEIAVAYGHGEVIKTLLESKVNVETSRPLMFVAASNNQPDAVKVLYESGIDSLKNQINKKFDVEDPNLDGFTIAHIAVFNFTNSSTHESKHESKKDHEDKALRMIDIIAEYKANLDIINDSYRSPLYLAMKNSNLGMAHRLLSKHADFYAGDVHTADGFKVLNQSFIRETLPELLRATQSKGNKPAPGKPRDIEDKNKEDKMAELALEILMSKSRDDKNQAAIVKAYSNCHKALENAFINYFESKTEQEQHAAIARLLNGSKDQNLLGVILNQHSAKGEVARFFGRSYDYPGTEKIAHIKQAFGYDPTKSELVKKQKGEAKFLEPKTPESQPDSKPTTPRSGPLG